MKRQPLDLGEIVDWLVRFFERKDRAVQRLSRSHNYDWFFAMLGLESEVDEFKFKFDPSIILQRVEEPPSVIELAAAAKDPTICAAIGRYSERITYELAVRNVGSESRSSFILAYLIVAAIRARSLIRILVPAAANRSWSSIAAFEDKSCEVQLVEDAPRTVKFSAPHRLMKSDLEWVNDNFESFCKLALDARFRLALESLSIHDQVTNLRMVVSSLWSGIEAIAGIQTELRFRLSSYMAAMLEPKGTKRLEFYKRLKKLYDVRSKAVHGGQIGETALLEHIMEVRKILSLLLCHIVGQKKVPTEEDFDRCVFE